MKTSPELQLRVLVDGDGRAGHKLLPLIRLVKGWMFSRSTPIALSSVHLETLLVGSRIAERPCSYAELLHDVFRLINLRRGAAVRDPLGFSGDIPLANSTSKVKAVLDQAEYAMHHAARAAEARTVDDAVRHWDLVFNGQFPKAN